VKGLNWHLHNIFSGAFSAVVAPAFPRQFGPPGLLFLKGEGE